MSSAAEWIRDAIASHLRADADEIVARATERDVEVAARASARARALLGTGAGREKLEEAVATRALDEASHGALLEHVAAIAEREVLARRSLAPFGSVSERVVVDGRERTLAELAIEARDPIPERARAASAALVAHLAKDRASRLEAFDEGRERRARIRARGPASPDDTPGDLAERCTAFLAATDDAAAELVDRAHHAIGVGRPTLSSLALALAPPPLDGFVPARARAARATAVIDALGLAGELRARVALVASSALSVRARVAVGARATVLAGGVEAGVPSERALLAGIGEALARALASPSLPIEHRVAPRASVAAAVGALFGGWLANERFVARHVDAPPAGRARLRVAATLGVVLEARHACAEAIAGPAAERTDGEARERVARALVLDPSEILPEIARSSWSPSTACETRARASLAALAWGPALRDRYDEDAFRNPRLADFVRGAAARGGTVSAEGITEELGAPPTSAGAWALELAARAGG